MMSEFNILVSLKSNIPDTLLTLHELPICLAALVCLLPEPRLCFHCVLAMVSSALLISGRRRCISPPGQIVHCLHLVVESVNYSTVVRSKYEQMPRKPPSQLLDFKTEPGNQIKFGQKNVFSSCNLVKQLHSEFTGIFDQS